MLKVHFAGHAHVIKLVLDVGMWFTDWERGSLVTNYPRASTLRTYEKFGNTLLDGLPGGFAPILVRNRRLFFNFMQKNYSKILITVIMTKTVLRSPVNR